MTDRPERWWQSRSNISFAVFIAVGGYFLWTEHSAHVIEYLPWALVLGCIGMHLFMHRRHGTGGRKHGHDDAPPSQRQTGRDQ